ncbi:MAG: thiolase C-terminal domain-containing protein [Candidatus Heimdallarchaeaceae archaeon]|jgi:acetyl-CoA C-acetyltransferase
MKHKVYITGFNSTKFGEHYSRSASSLATQALLGSIKNAEIKKESIQTAFFGSLVSGSNSQTSIGSTCIRECGLDIPITRIEAGNASGAAAFQQAYFGILSGQFDCVAVVGIEKLSDYVKGGTIEKILGATIDYHWEFEMGATLTSLYAILTKAHMKEYNTTPEQLAAVPVKNHKNGVKNPLAQFRREISLDRFLKAKRIADPIGRFDPATYCDGASSIILSSSKFIAENPDITTKVPIVGLGHASDTISLHHRDTLTSFKATKRAADQAFKMANINSKDINVAEVHDSYPIGEILAIEDIGFFPKGEGGKATEEGLTSLDSEISINPSGGLKARGDPFGATGIAQIVEIVEQMKGEAGERQIADLNFGLTQNVSGTGAMTYISILAREEVKK